MQTDLALPPTLQDLEAMRLPVATSIAVDQPNGFRLKTMRDLARALGARAGASARGTEIAREIEEAAPTLDRIYDFRALQLDGGVLPPVIVEGRHAMSQPDSDTLAVAEQVFRIVQPPRLAPVVPTWRDYLMVGLIQDGIRFELPHPAVQPKTEEERLLWKASVNEGWKAGVNLAEDTFRTNTARLERDLLGMALFHSLYARGMLTRPEVAEGIRGNTGDPKREMKINDRVYRITVKPEFKLESASWTAGSPR